MSPNGLAATEFLYELPAKKKLDDLILPKLVRQGCAQFLEEHHQADLLQAHDLEPRHRVLLSGPPGNGKTSVAEALAQALDVPYFVVRYDRLIAGTLSETMVRVGLLFDYVRPQRCVLFFDEFDTVGKERGDPHDAADLKRAVGPLLVHIDTLPPQVVIVTATNHLELLDHAVWRRFQIRLHLPRPTRTQVEEWFAQIELPEEYSATDIAHRLFEASFAELEDFREDLRRRRILAGPDADMNAIVRERLSQWSRRMIPAGYGRM